MDAEAGRGSARQRPIAALGEEGRPPGTSLFDPGSGAVAEGPDAVLCNTPMFECDWEAGTMRMKRLYIPLPDGTTLVQAGQALQSFWRWLRPPQVSKEAARSIRSLEERLAEHRAKLDAYRRNPDSFDNKDFLKNAPSEEVRKRIIDGRIKHLEQEIENFSEQIRKLRGGP
jgi:hypothetical protein